MELGRLEIPPDADVASFLLSDGKLNGKPQASKAVTLGEVFAKYRESLPTDSLEPETIRVAEIHMGHVEEVLGSRFAIHKLTQSHLQDYVLQRSKRTGHRGRPLSATTIKKELGTLSPSGPGRWPRGT